MKLSLAPRRYVLTAIGIAFLAAGGVATLLPPGQAGAQQGPTIELLPPSGPCDASLEARGRGFEPPPAGLATRGLYLVQPGTADINMRILNAASVARDGTFTTRLGPGEPRCQAAALDSQREEPSGYLLVVVSSSGTRVEPGERIPDIVATARYEYTTTAPPPPPIMVISPSKGPCDATVQITGRDFPPSTAIRLDVARPGEGTLGKLTSLVTDPLGTFSVTVDLGSLGCEGARAVEALDPASQELGVFADLGQRVPIPGTGIPPILTRTLYTYTTTAVSPEGLLASLPPTGGGPDVSSVRPGPLVLAGALAGLGVMLVMVSLYRRRKRT